MTDPTDLIARARVNAFPTHADALALADALAAALTRQAETENALTAAASERDRLRMHAEALEAENAHLKNSVIAFCAPHAARYAREFGFPEGHLHPTHYDILANAGARMDDFTRAALTGEPQP